MQLGEDNWIPKEKVIHMQTPTIPEELREALEDDEGAMATLDGMPVDYRRRAFLFIDQATNPPTRHNRVSNFVEVVKFFQQDSGE
jgi:uncharacterized protein YdeI (YjbR/CyaY-like superfamily)